MNKVKRIAAIIGVILLVSLYVVTFIASINSSKYSNGLFTACIFATFAVPVMIYAFMLVYRVLKKLGHPDNPGDRNNPDSKTPKTK